MDNIWQSEEEFKKLTGMTTEIKEYRQDNPGLWRITAAGKTIYNIKSWVSLHKAIAKMRMA